MPVTMAPTTARLRTRQLGAFQTLHYTLQTGISTRMDLLYYRYILYPSSLHWTILPLFPGNVKKLTFLCFGAFFEVTDWVGGSTQNVSLPKDISLPKDVFLRKESEESYSPAQRNLAFHLHWNVFV